MSKPEIKLILFDLSGVLLVDTAGVFMRTFGFSKLSKKEKAKYQKAWHSRKTDAKRMPKLMQTFKTIFQLPYSFSEIEKLFTVGVAIEAIWPIFNSLKKHYRVAILTNSEIGWPEKMLQNAHRNIGNAKIFNSAEIGYRKPDPHIFKYVLEETGLKASEVLLIDDQERNVRAARRQDLKAIRFTGNMPSFVDALKKYNLEIKINKLNS